ncbi:MAG: cupin domain-containing protein [Bacteroidota bacterium]
MEGYFTLIDTVPEQELVPGFHGRMVHTDGLTIAHFRVEAGSRLPEHHHIHEQVTNVLSGELEMTVGGETYLCTAGTVVTVPPNVPHSAIAHTDCRLVDIFNPVREDYKLPE